MSGWTLYLIAIALLLILIGRTIPLAVEEIRNDLYRRKMKRGDPIDWTADHNLKLPTSPYFDPRVEFSEEEAFLDLVEDNARMRRELDMLLAKNLGLEAELDRQSGLKLRYLRELRRAKR